MVGTGCRRISWIISSWLKLESLLVITPLLNISILPSYELFRSKLGRLVFLILDKLLVISLFLIDQFVFNFFIFLPAASAIFDKLELDTFAEEEVKSGESSLSSWISC